MRIPLHGFAQPFFEIYFRTVLETLLRKGKIGEGMPDVPFAVRSMLCFSRVAGKFFKDIKHLVQSDSPTGGNIKNPPCSFRRGRLACQ